MTLRTELRAVLTTVLLLASLRAGAVVFTGQTEAIDAQSIYTPQANMAPITLRYFVAEGQHVNKGDVVLRIDPGQSATKVEALDAQIEQAQARAAKELAELQVKAVDAQLAVIDAQAALDTAKIDAAIPADLISKLDHDRHQGALASTTRELALKREELANARDAIGRRRSDAELEVKRLQVERDYNVAVADAAEVRADRSGTVLHGFNNNWIGGRIDEGSSTMPGNEAGQVVAGGKLRVRAWVLAPDRRGLRVGQAVQLVFDAYPVHPARGRITAIAGAPEPKREWGDGRYFAVAIELLGPQDPRLLPGMSVRVMADAAAHAGKVAR